MLSKETLVEQDNVIRNVPFGQKWFMPNSMQVDHVVNREQGVFLVLSRFPVEGSERYLIKGQLTPAEFYRHIGSRGLGPCTADDISDHLVRAFDFGVAEDLGLGPAMFAYMDEQGLTVEQHST